MKKLRILRYAIWHATSLGARPAMRRPDRTTPNVGSTRHRPPKRSNAAAAACGIAGALAFAAATVPAPVHAHHGWSSFDTSAPVYLSGTVRQVTWANPHAMLVIEPDARAALPSDLAGRNVPPQVAPVDAAAVLGKATLPRGGATRWTVELAPMSRLEAWRLAPINVGDRVEVVGYALSQPQAEPLMRVEYLFRDGRAYGLRSSPAGS